MVLSIPSRYLDQLSQLVCGRGWPHFIYLLIYLYKQVLKQLLRQTTCSSRHGRKPTRVQPAAEREAAVLLVEREGVHLQAAGHRHLHGPVVPHRAGRVHVDVGDRRGLARVDTGGEHM